MGKEKLIPFHLFLSLLFLVLSFESSSALKTRSSKRLPRFLGRFSQPRKPLIKNPLNYRYETRYFDQNLDHFSFADLPKFRQRYLISFEHWAGPAKAGPIFFYCGNEGYIDWFAENTGFVWELAPRFGAMVIFPEHRYYGESMPYGSSGEAYKNATTLSYLTAEQALADYAILLTDLKKNLSAETCPVVLFGGSYGGMLAAWMRLKYPHISVGALASSAPVLQFEDIVPSETFYDIVSNVFRHESTSCFNTIKSSWDILVAEGHKEDGLLQLTKTFHLCRKLKSIQDLSDWWASAYTSLAMANYPYPAEFLMPLPGNPIKEVCRNIDSCPDGTSVLERIFKGLSVYYNYTGSADCFNLDDDPHGEDGWNWQACTEMVMPMSSNRYSSMFPEYHYNYSDFKVDCWKDFKVKPRPTWISTEFGGHIERMVGDALMWDKNFPAITYNLHHNSCYDFKGALEKFGSNIIFSNGLLDPWSGGSVLEDISESIRALVTEKGAHHIDLRAATAEDPEWLMEQRAKEIKHIEGWIKSYNNNKGHDPPLVVSSTALTQSTIFGSKSGMSDLCALSQYICYSQPCGMFLPLQKYANEILWKTTLTNCKPCATLLAAKPNSLKVQSFLLKIYHATNSCEGTVWGSIERVLNF